MRFPMIQKITAVLLTVGMVSTLVAREPINSKSSQRNIKTKAAGCAPATAIANLNFNNVQARIENGGNMWQDRSNNTPSYEIPKGSGKASIFAGALWMGGVSPNGQLKIAAVTFRSGTDDYWPGPLRIDGTASTDESTCNEFDRFYEAFKPDVIIHNEYHTLKYLSENGTDAEKLSAASQLEELFPDGYSAPKYFSEWPGNGEAGFDPILAPFQEGLDGTIGEYEPEKGDYPGYDLQGQIKCRDVTREVPLFGDTTIYWIFNDKGNIHTSTGSEPIGMEVRGQAFAFADEGPINNMTFYNYVLINQGSQTLENTYFGQWVDADLGNAFDDYVGCDVQRGLGYCYNGDNEDEVTGGSSPGYGLTPPAVGVDFFQGPFQDRDADDETIPFESLGLKPGDNPGPYDEDFAPEGIRNISYVEANQGRGIPYLGIGIGYADGVPDNERFGMRKFLYYNNGGGVIGDPSTGQNYYNYLRGVWIDNSRFVYGGNAHWDGAGSEPAYPAGAVSATAFCDFMFPGASDPVNFGSAGIDYTSGGTDVWTESTAGNPPGDRRFMQSAGPFTLRPGDINNITVGVVWARASSGNALASVNEMFAADDIAQGLFDNCFQIFEGPDAPDVKIRELDRELILYLDNPPSSNNAGETYAKKKPDIPDFTIDEDGDTTFFNKTYAFEGYQIYQLKDPTVTAGDLRNSNLAKLVAQVDVRNFETVIDENGVESLDFDQPIGQLVNYEVDPETGLPVPIVKVNGSNKGIQKSFRVTEDLFSNSADKRLVNNKPYYFMAIAYAHNNYQDYNPVSLSGQAEVYVSSRKNGRGGSIAPAFGIPHKTENQAGGTKLNSEYGEILPLTRLEGAGNDGFFVRITPETEEAIMDGEPWYSKEVGYQKGASPIEVKIVDPVRLEPAEYELRFSGRFEPTNYGGDSIRWTLTNLSDGEVEQSASTLEVGGESLILKWGISVSINQPTYLGGLRQEKSSYIGAEMVFEDPLKPWLSGVGDIDGEVLFNWIRSGNLFSGTAFPDNPTNRDLDEEYENILGGTWAPYALTGDTISGIINTDLTGMDNRTTKEARIANSPNVDIVFTSDKSKWTRVPVLEASDNPNLAKGNVPKSLLRAHASVDKNFRTVEEGGDIAEATLNGLQDSGMSWFPGYAIDVLTGERLNMAFFEDSWLTGENGNDMIWNPTSRVTTQIGGGSPNSFLFGGKHFILVFKNMRRLDEFLSSGDNKQGVIIDSELDEDYIGVYDEGQTLYRILKDNTDEQSAYRRLWRSCGWVGFPLLAQNFPELDPEQGLIPTETRVSIRLSRRFEPYATGDETELLQDEAGVDNMNGHKPLYRFTTDGFGPVVGNTAIVKDNLDQIRVVPNPYYAYSEYESDRLDNRVKFTNLPEQATISIYTLEGALIRQFRKDDASTIVEWDLKNDANIPLASGMYVVHIEVPGVGERVLKWFAMMREVDLQNL